MPSSEDPSRDPASATTAGASRTEARTVPGRRTRRLGSVAVLIAGALAAASAFSPWWYISTTSPGTSSGAEFYPGDAIYAGGGGGGGLTTYAAYGLTGLGELYESVLVLALLLAVLSWALGGYGLAVSSEKAGGREGVRLARRALLVGIAVAGGVAAAVPLVQPVLYRDADPGGACSTGPSNGPCRSFWGTLHAVGSTTVWGAGAGWWLDVATLALLVVGLYLGTLRPALRARTPC